MVTMREVAARAGVSHATVSYVLNDRKTGVAVSPATQERVLKAAAELGYRRNGLARAIRAGKSNQIGILVHSFAAQNVSLMLEGAICEAEKHDLTLQFFRLHDQQNDIQTVEKCLEGRVGGLIALYTQGAVLEALNRESVRCNLPVVHLDSSVPGALGARIFANEEQGFALALDYLKSLGHQKIAFFDQPLTGRPRAAVFEAVAAQMGLEVQAQWRVFCENAEVAPQKARELLALDVPPTALLCATDFLATVVQRAIIEAGVTVPAQMSVMGFGGLMPAYCATPRLSTVCQPFEAMGRAAVQRLIEMGRSDERNDAFFELKLDNTLAVRDSTGPVSQG